MLLVVVWVKLCLETIQRCAESTLRSAGGRKMMSTINVTFTEGREIMCYETIVPPKVT